MTSTRNEGPVALFAGGTAGLGEAILKAYAKKHCNARIYIVGRNETAAAQIEEDVRREWKENSAGDKGGDVVFIKADLSLLRNSPAVLDAFLEREGSDAKLDFLCMSQGFLTLKSRLETAEHHDAPLVLQFYSRAHLTHLLMPHLRGSDAAHGARVVSVHAPGHEGPLWLDDLELRRRHATAVDWVFPGWLRWLTGLDPGFVWARVSHSVVMTTLFFERLARREREGAARPLVEVGGKEGTGVAFLHVFPGLVKTKEFEKGDFPPAVKFFLMYIMLPLLTPFTVAVGTVGESIAAMAEDATLRGAAAGEGDECEAAIGSDGAVGSGVYCLNWDGKRLINDKPMKAHREKGAIEVVWDHCLAVFDGDSGAQDN